MLVTRLVPDSFYWARPKSADSQPTIVQVSKVFGEDRDFWTLTTIGSSEHHMPCDFDIIAEIDKVTVWEPMQQAAE
jgi:hypothetical protein